MLHTGSALLALQGSSFAFIRNPNFFPSSHCITSAARSFEKGTFISNLDQLRICGPRDRFNTSISNSVSFMSMSTSRTMTPASNLSTCSTATTREKKQALRKEIRSKLRSLTQQEISEQSSKVWEKVFSLPQYQRANSVGLFLSMPKGEIMTEEACTRVLLDGKTLYVPRVGLDFEKCDMELVRVNRKEEECTDKDESTTMFYHDWPRNKWGIPEPPLDCEDLHPVAKPGDIDLLLVPGLGFDRFGGRLGQGKGYYDRFINKMRSTADGGGDDCDGTSSSSGDLEFCGYRKPLLCAVGLEPSLVDGDGDCIPVSSHDYMMDMIVLPNIETVTVTHT